MDRILLPDKTQLFWLFFRFSGRVSRAAYILGFLFMTVVMAFPLYQFMRVPEESGAAQMWSLVFGITMLFFAWVHVAFSVKRLHDIGRPGILSIALFVPVVSIIAFLALCIMPGTPGSNRYGRYANMPAGEG